jgi:hypothetical protein
MWSVTGRVLEEPRIVGRCLAGHQTSQAHEASDDRDDAESQQGRWDEQGANGLRGLHGAPREIDGSHRDHRRASRRPASTATSFRRVVPEVPNGVTHVR